MFNPVRIAREIWDAVTYNSWLKKQKEEFEAQQDELRRMNGEIDQMFDPNGSIKKEGP